MRFTISDEVPLMYAYNQALMATEAVYAGEYIDTPAEVVERGIRHERCVYDELIAARRFIAAYCKAMLDVEEPERKH
jgi:hypothetical protein